MDELTDEQKAYLAEWERLDKLPIEEVLWFEQVDGEWRPRGPITELAKRGVGNKHLADAISKFLVRYTPLLREKNVGVKQQPPQWELDWTKVREEEQKRLEEEQDAE